MADQIVNVDVSAEDLRDRLQSGRIYPNERVQRALANFFTPDNLTRLREIALEEIAHLLDRRRHEQGPEQRRGSARVMVSLSSRGPNASALLRKTARLAERLDAPWYAVYIQTPQESLERIDAATQREVSNTLVLAQQLGGTPMTFKGSDVVRTIEAFVKEYGITHIVLGRTRRPWYRRWLGPSILDRLLLTIPDVDVVVVNNQPIET
jgi:two-component system sensor histidine kinase KdpD